jgi:membrane AbrB-like protein
MEAGPVAAQQTPVSWRAGGRLQGGHRPPPMPDPVISTAPVSAVALRRFALALAISLVAGAFCAWVRTPLPWLIGPLFACAIASANGLPVGGLLAARSAGHWVIGTALGLFFTPDVLVRLVHNLGLLVLAQAWAIGVGLALAWALRRHAGLDPATAFFAGAIGGASEMAIQGERNGARVDLIAAVHSMRILLVVTVMPFAFQWLGVHGSDPSQRLALEVQWWPGMPLLVAATLAGVLLVRRLGAPTPWLIGALLAAVGLSGSGLVLSALPAWLISLGQVLIGISLGTRFAPGFFERAPRALAVVGVATLLAIGASAAFAWLLAAGSGVPWATLALATSPGGIAEMALTAKLLELGVPMVTLFHLVRVLALVLFGGMLYRALARRLGWPLGRPA